MVDEVDDAGVRHWSSWSFLSCLSPAMLWSSPESSSSSFGGVTLVDFCFYFLRVKGLDENKKKNEQEKDMKEETHLGTQIKKICYFINKFCFFFFLAQTKTPRSWRCQCKIKKTWFSPALVFFLLLSPSRFKSEEDDDVDDNVDDEFVVGVVVVSLSLGVSATEEGIGFLFFLFAFILECDDLVK